MTAIDVLNFSDEPWDVTVEISQDGEQRFSESGTIPVNESRGEQDGAWIIDEPWMDTLATYEIRLTSRRGAEFQTSTRRRPDDEPETDENCLWVRLLLYDQGHVQPYISGACQPSHTPIE